MKFDPIANGQNKLKEDGSLLRYLLARQYGQYKPMGNIAHCQLSYVISYWLAALHAGIEPIIHSSNLWLDKAIGGDEKFGGSHGFSPQAFTLDSAMGKGLENASNDEGHWNQACVCEEAA